MESTKKTNEPSATYIRSQLCVEDAERWFGDQAASKSIPHHALALAGEVGEFCNIVKKIERGSLSLNDAKVRFDLAMELTDVYTYMLNIAGLLHIDLERSFGLVRANNEKRFMEERRIREAKNNG